MGAAFLQDQLSTTQRKDIQVLVVDIGGTTSDVCALLPSGMPRKAPEFVDVAGVRKAFSMPEVYSICLGGGSRVRVDANGKVTVGPDSVGHKLTQEAMVFGGLTMTATDIMVAAGHSAVGDKENVKTIPQQVIDTAIVQIQQLLERAADKMKVSAEPVMVLLVGRGSIIFPQSMSVTHVEPVHHDAANAVGAAIAKVAGDVDIIEILSGREESEVVENVRRQAVLKAVEARADEQDVRIAGLTKIPLQYVNNKATGISVKAVGSLRNASRKINEQKSCLEDDTEEAATPVNL